MQNRITCKQIVASVCLKYPEAKNNYGVLYHRVVEMLGITTLDSYFEALARGGIYSPETITRAYRELRTQNPDVFNPSEDVQVRRVNCFELTRQYYAKNKIKKKSTRYALGVMTVGDLENEKGN